MKKRKLLFIVSIVVILAMAMFCTGCKKDDSKESNNEEKKTTEESKINLSELSGEEAIKKIQELGVEIPEDFKEQDSLEEFVVTAIKVVEEHEGMWDIPYSLTTTYDFAEAIRKAVCKYHGWEETQPTQPDILYVMQEYYKEDYEFIKNIEQIKLDENTLDNMVKLCGESYEKQTSEVDNTYDIYTWNNINGRKCSVNLVSKDATYTNIEVMFNDISTSEENANYTLEDCNKVKKGMMLMEVQSILGEGAVNYLKMDLNMNSNEWNINYCYIFPNNNKDAMVGVIFNDKYGVDSIIELGRLQ